jgi:hypothetical protein
MRKRNQTTTFGIILCWFVLCDGHQFYIFVWDWECPKLVSVFKGFGHEETSCAQESDVEVH